MSGLGHTSKGLPEATIGSSLLLHNIFFSNSSVRSALAVVCIMDSTPNTCADTVQEEGFREEEGMSGCGEQKKLQRTGSSG